MGLIKEPLNVDFYVDARPMTPEDEKAISEYIKADKLKHRSRKLRERKTSDPISSKAKTGR